MTGTGMLYLIIILPSQTHTMKEQNIKKVRRYIATNGTTIAGMNVQVAFITL
jgi:hypothetical protein